MTAEHRAAPAEAGALEQKAGDAAADDQPTTGQRPSADDDAARERRRIRANRRVHELERRRRHYQIAARYFGVQAAARRARAQCPCGIPGPLHECQEAA